VTDRVKWGPKTPANPRGTRADFVDFAAAELARARAARSALERKWITWLNLYRPLHGVGVKSFPYEDAPLSRDTEVLTISGWRRVDEVFIGEPILTRRDDDGTMAWAPIEALPQHFASELLHFKSRSMDLLVTEAHTMLCERATVPGKIVRMPAAKLWNTTGYYLPQHGTWRAPEPAKLFGHDAGDVCEFVGWYVAEGYIADSGTVGICQSKTANPERVWRIEQLLTRLGWAFSYNDTQFLVSRRSIPVALHAALMGSRLAHRKRVPPFIFTLGPKLIERFVSAAIAGDGTVTDTPDTNFPKVEYYTTSKRLADEMQMLAVLVGMHARVRQTAIAGKLGGTIDGRQIVAQRPAYTVVFCATPRAKYDRAKCERVQYNDIAYCVTVRNHAIYVRRHGKAVWTGNSNITFPFAQMSVNPILANEMQVLFATDNLWTLSPLNARWVNHAKPLQDFLAFLQRHILRMWDVVHRSRIEKFKLGTTIFKTAWEWRQNTVTGYDAQLRRERQLRTLNRPFVDHVRLADFFVPPEALEIDPDVPGGAVWVAERFRLAPGKFRALATGQEPFRPNYDAKAVADVLASRESALTDDEQARRVRDRMGDSPPDQRVAPVELFEMHARFDTTGNGIEDDVVATFHERTHALCQDMYNPFAHGKRPYDVERFLRADGFYGIGVCEQAEVWQFIISEMLNTSIDKARLSNAPMLKFREGANILPNEPIYPTKMWPLQNPEDDLVPLFLTDNRGNFDFQQLIGFALDSGNNHVGISDIRRGNIASLPSRTPATTVQSMLQESNTLLDLSIKDARKGGLSAVGLKVLQLLQQMTAQPGQNPQGDQYLRLAAMVLGPQGQYIAEALSLPFEDIATGIGVELTATSSTNNKVLEQQKLMGVLQLAASIGPQVVQLLGFAQQQPGTPAAASAVGAAEGIIELFRRLLEQHDIRNVNDILPEEGVAQLLAMAQAGPQGGAPVGQAAGPGGVGPSGPPQGAGGF
jgi:hypothetical protein